MGSTVIVRREEEFFATVISLAVLLEDRSMKPDCGDDSVVMVLSERSERETP